MSVILKRSDPELTISKECHYGCCTELYGKSVKIIRRNSKRSARQKLSKELRNWRDQ